MGIQREIIFKADDSQFASIVDRVGKSISGAFEEAGKSVDSVNKRMNDFSGSVRSEMDRIQNSGKNAFADLLRNSEKYSTNVKDRITYLQRELQLQQSLLREETSRLQLASKLRYEAEKQTMLENGASASSPEMADLKDRYNEEQTQIETDARIKQLKLKAAQNEFQQYRANETERKHDEDDHRRGGGYGGGIVRSALAGAFGAAGFGAVFSIAGILGKIITEGEELSRAQTRIGGLTSGMGGLGIGRMYDFKTADAMRYDEEVARQAGTSFGLAGRGRRQYSFERSFGLNAGELNNNAIALRMSTTHRSSADVAIEMLNFFKQSKVFGIDKGDFAKVSELLSINNQLNQEQVEQTGRVDPRQTTALMAMFGRLGIDSSRIMSYEGGINTGIRSPHDEFSGAVVLRALRRANPGMSLFQLQEQQAKGATPSNISAVMSEFGHTSSGELMMRTVQSAFGLEPAQARTLVEAYQKNPRVFDTQEGMKLAGSFTRKSVEQRAAENTTFLQDALSKFNDKFADLGQKTLAELAKLVNAYETKGFEGMVKQGIKDIVDAIVDGFKRVTGQNVSGKEMVEHTNETFKKVANNRLGNMFGYGVDVPGDKGVLYHIQHRQQLQNMFSDQVTYMVDKKDYLKDVDYGRHIGFRGEPKELQAALSDTKYGELQKVIELLDTKGNKYFPNAKADDDEIITVKVLQQILDEIRKQNKKPSQNVIHKGK